MGHGCCFAIMGRQEGRVADSTQTPTEGLTAEKAKTQEETLVTERLPVHWSWLMRFTLFPPQDNVIVANGRRGHPLSSIQSAAKASLQSGLVDGSAFDSPVLTFSARSAPRALNVNEDHITSA